MLRRPYKRDSRTAWLNMRFLCYLRACFGSGATYHWATEKVYAFAESGQLDPKHLCERWFKQFRGWCTEYKFDRAPKPRKGTRGGSSAWRVQAAEEVRGRVPMPEIVLRLHGAVRAVADKYGRAHVDFEFIRKFCAHTSLPIEAVEVAWRKTKKISGLAVAWKGCGNGVKFVAVRERPEVSQNSVLSNPQTSSALSSPSGRRIEYKQGLRPRPERDTAGADAPTTQPTTAPGEFEQVAASARPGDPEPRSAKRPRALPARYAAFGPFQICGRWFSPLALFAKACWISHRLLKPVHFEYPRINYDSRHATNFAFEALCLGYGADEICAAWREGVRRSHADASLAGDRWRVPSAAKKFAGEALRARDDRPAEFRWREFLSSPRPAAGSGGGMGGAPAGGAVPAAGSVPSASTRGGSAVAGSVAPLDGGAAALGENAAAAESARERAAKMARLRSSLAEKFPDGRSPRTKDTPMPELSQGELAAGLRERGMTFGEFQGCPWKVKQDIWRSIAAKRRAADGPR